MVVQVESWEINPNYIERCRGFMKNIILGLTVFISTISLYAEEVSKQYGECEVKINREDGSLLGSDIKIWTLETTREACFFQATNNALINKAEKLVVKFKVKETEN